MKFKIKELFFKGSQREAVIVSTVYIEVLLEELLIKSVICEDKKALFGNNGPANTLSNKILTCYSFGLIPRSIYIILEILRKIRNKCAHSINEKNDFRIDLSEHEYLDILRNVFPNKDINKIQDVSQKKHLHKLRNENIDKSTSITFYFYLVLSVIDYLESRTKDEKTIKHPSRFKLKHIQTYFTHDELKKITQAYNQDN
ncbi:MAG: hypothetical protein Q8Q23_01225 [bacterium]|nr:hypothetical protein [bacterium]